MIQRLLSRQTTRCNRWSDYRASSRTRIGLINIHKRRRPCVYWPDHIHHKLMDSANNEYSVANGGTNDISDSEEPWERTLVGVQGSWSPKAKNNVIIGIVGSLVMGVARLHGNGSTHAQLSSMATVSLGVCRISKIFWGVLRGINLWS